MRTSPIGVKKIAAREGTVLHVNKDSKGLPTAGVGHLITAAEKKDYPVGKHITQAESDAWLAADLKECEDAVNALDVKLKQNEFDALVSLAFNIGVGAASGKHKGGFLGSTVARKLKAGDKKGAASAILLWNKPPEIQGRRRTEYNQFLTPYKDSAAVQTAENLPLNAVNIANPGASSAAPNSASEDIATPEQPSIITETKITEAKQLEESTVVTEQTATQPKGDAPEVSPTKVTVNGPISNWLFGGGGLMALLTGIWGIVQANLGAIAVGLICATALIVIIIFRKAITDAIRMQVAADPDKKNVT